MIGDLKEVIACLASVKAERGLAKQKINCTYLSVLCNKEECCLPLYLVNTRSFWVTVSTILKG